MTQTTSDAIECAFSAPPFPRFDLLTPDLAKAGPCHDARTGFHVLADVALLAPRPSTPSSSPMTPTTSDANECASSAPPLPRFDLLAPGLAKLLEPCV
jgi:hypothetical protein